MSTNYRRDAMNRYQIQLPFSPGASMSTPQVAAILDCGEDAVRTLIHLRKLVAYRLRPIPRSPWRIYKDSVARFLDELHQEADLETFLSSPRPSPVSARRTRPAHKLAD